MTENGKIFIIKNSILNLLANELLSIGLSLYIIKDILQELQLMYDLILIKELNLDKEKLDKKELNNSDQAD